MTTERAPVPQRVLRGTSETLSVAFEQGGGIVDPAAVTLTLMRADGTALATNAATAGSGAVARTYALAATATQQLDILTAVWTSSTLGTLTTTVEIVGDVLFTIAEARAFDKGQLADAAAYPNAAILEGRTRIEDAFYRICRVAFAPRYKRITLDGGTLDYRLQDRYIVRYGDDLGVLVLPDQRVTALRTIEERAIGGQVWTAFDAGQLADVNLEPDGHLYRETGGIWTVGRQNYRIAYEYGWEAPPLPIARAALVLLTNLLVPSNLPERAMSLSDSAGTFRLATAGYGRNNWFGIPFVDSTLEQFREYVPGIG